MNLGEAYQGWQQMQDNRELYMKTRDAFRKAWFTLPTNKPCSYYTKEVLGTALAATREVESNKAKAASVMVHVLTFANWADPKSNPKPDFTYQDLMEYTKGPLADPDKIASKRGQDDDHGFDPVTDTPRRAMEQESSEAAMLREYMSVQELDIRRIETHTTPVLCDEHGDALPKEVCERRFEKETQTEDNMEHKKTRGRKPKQEKTVVKPSPAEQVAATPDPAPPPAAPHQPEEQVRNAAADALAVFTDDELMDELDRRGWTGELRRLQIVTIGKD